MAEFILTFGVQYGFHPSKDRHPIDERIDGNGYIRVIAADYEAARQLVTSRFSDRWSFLYRAEDHDADAWAPLGQIGLLDNEGLDMPSLGDLLDRWVELRQKGIV